MPTPQKEETISELSTALQGSQALLFTDYRGLTVAQVSALRAQLRESETTFAVVKNTLFKRAADGIITIDSDIDATLNGPTAVAFAMKDPVATAKVFVDYIAANRQTPLKIKGGLISGKFITTAQVTDLSKTPPREVLISQMLGSFNAPITGFVTTLNGIIANFVYTLQAVADQKAVSEPAA